MKILGKGANYVLECIEKATNICFYEELGKVIEQLKKWAMKKIILLALTALIMVGCAGRMGSKTDRLVNDGHDYQWIMFYDRPYLVHSPECDSCKSIRRQEIKALFNELKEK